MDVQIASELSPDLIESRPARLDNLARLDRRLAWVVTCAPAVGFGVAMLLLLCGYPVGAVEIGLWLGMHILILIGVEVGFHRHFAHRSFNLRRPVRVALAILGSMAFQGPVIWWAATHRRHHNYSDKPGDPHSPHLHGEGPQRLMRGLFHAHMGWLFVPESTRAVGWDRYAHDLYRDKAVFKVHTLYFYWLLLGFVIPAILGGILTRTWMGAFLGFLWGGLVRIFMMNHVFYWCINSVTHTFGTRPFVSNDQSTNNIWLAIPTLGQSWHNNHHAFPSSAMMGLRWWEVDIGGWVVRALERLNLAWDVKTPSQAMMRRLRRN
ncbi:MAG: acyl-CoA desaturase [Acidobacteria bacterium]|nr:MAG: acyl-CoA desaturase [Acidobacteriota bacterium]